MRQLMGQLSPMPAPQGMDMGGGLLKGIQGYLDNKKQADQATRMQALIDALKPKTPADMMGPPGAGMGPMSMPAEGMGVTQFGGGLPPVY